MNFKQPQIYLFVLFILSSIMGFSQSVENNRIIEAGVAEKAVLIKSLSNEQKVIFSEIESGRKELFKKLETNPNQPSSTTQGEGKEKTVRTQLDSEEFKTKQDRLRKKAMDFYNGLNQDQKNKFCFLQKAIGSKCPE